jgi:GAF domain-containing protein
MRRRRVVFGPVSPGEANGCTSHWTCRRVLRKGGEAMIGAEGDEEAAAARQLAVQRLNRLLTLILDAATDALGFDGATITVRHGDDFGTVAATSPSIVALDAAQYSDGEGPCLEALEAGDVVTWSAEDEEARWRAFQEAAEDLGIATSLSVPLPIDETIEIASSLNLYAHTRERITSEQLELATQFALQLATALQTIDTTNSTARIARRAAKAIRSQAAIEQAKGFLMAQRGITPGQASALLAEMAGAENATLRHVAGRIIDRNRAGEPPTPPG